MGGKRRDTNRSKEGEGGKNKRGNEIMRRGKEVKQIVNGRKEGKENHGGN